MIHSVYECKNVLRLLAFVSVALTGPNGYAQNTGTMTGDKADSIVYTDSQANRGGALFEQHCSRCHSPEEFSGVQFSIIWEEKSVFDLYYKIATTMPMDQPGSLGQEQLLSLVAFILRMNNFTSGDAPLPPSEEQLQTMLLVP